MAAITPIRKYPTRYYRMVRELMQLMDTGSIEDLYVLIRTAQGTTVHHFTEDEVNMPLHSRVLMNQALIEATIVDSNNKKG